MYFAARDSATKLKGIQKCTEPIAFPRESTVLFTRDPATTALREPIPSALHGIAGIVPLGASREGIQPPRDPNQGVDVPTPWIPRVGLKGNVCALHGIRLPWCSPRDEIQPANEIICIEHMAIYIFIYLHVISLHICTVSAGSRESKFYFSKNKYKLCMLRRGALFRRFELEK